MLTHKELIKYCNATYLDSVTLFNHELGLNREQTIVYYGDSLHKYIVEHDDCYVIVFRGSVNKFDWINDFTFKTTDFNHVNVHQGFFSALEAELNPRTKFDKPVIITGHSLGGALAILEAYKLSVIGSDIKEVVAFGNPMVGANSFRSDYEKLLGDKTTRYVNGDDIVPYLPWYKFYQVGKCVLLGNKSSWFNPLKYYRMIHSHHIQYYVKSMGAL